MSRPPRRFTNPARAAAAARPPAELTAEIASTRDGRDITAPFLGELLEFRDRRLLGAVDWGVYDRILLDDQVKSCLEQRRSAVVAREWGLIPGAADARAKAAADALEANLLKIDFDGATDKMLYAPFYGVARGELIWGAAGGLWEFDIKVRHARRFREDKDGELRLLTPSNMRGEILPKRKFWTMTVGGSDDDHPYGRGLAEWLYWPTLFKRNGIRFWNLFLDKFSLPPVKGTYPRGSSQEERDKLLAAMMALANDSGISVPEGVVVEFMNIAESGVSFETMPKYMDEAIAKIILSQTMTTEDGSSRAQGQVHAGVKADIITADADLLCGSFNRGPARWFTDFNFGTNVASPILQRMVDEEENLKHTAETDEVLSRNGWERTDESFREIYGDGFQRKPEPEVVPTPVKTGVNPRKPDAANDDGGEEEQPAAAASFAEPRPLYIYRRLRNAKALVAWAKSQGFKSTLPGGEMHVTVAYSRRPVDMFKIGQAWTMIGESAGVTVSEGGPRAVERLGDQGAVVLRFSSSNLEARHREICDAGASWDYPEYQPHVTITYDPRDVDLDQVEPFQGELLFGPEIFEPLDESWRDEIEEVAFTEPPPAADIVDQATAQVLADEGWREVADNLGVSELVSQLTAAKNADEVRAILERAADPGDLGPLAECLARAGFAVRAAAAISRRTGDRHPDPAPPRNRRVTGPLRPLIGLPPNDTRRAFEARMELRATVKWHEMWQGEHARAFTVAKLARLDLLDDIRNSLADALNNGATLDQWKANLVPTLQRAGWWGRVGDRDLTGTSAPVNIGPRRLETIFRTNMRVSRAAGQWARIQDRKDVAPFLAYFALDDGRARHKHAEWGGLLGQPRVILPVDDPTWDWLYPPNDWGCRCHVIQLSQTDLDRRGWKVSPAPERGTLKRFFRAGSATPEMVPEGIGPGWAYNPGKASQQAVAEKAEAVLNAIAAADTDEAFRRMLWFARDPSVDFAVTFGEVGAESLPGLDGFARQLAVSEVRHTFARHGAGSGDQFPVVADDFLLIPRIVAQGRRIDQATTKSAEQIFVLEIDGLFYIYVERIGRKRGRVMGRSLFKTDQLGPRYQ